MDGITLSANVRTDGICDGLIEDGNIDGSNDDKLINEGLVDGSIDGSPSIDGMFEAPSDGWIDGT